ncbi:MAG TPA: peptidoglycan-binding protein [Intrasporangium sp.]|uniref:peptidoglycan-binding domain-containing protein n=1 Tax=Intrasporangium sp. TaxID=1925024 RepID=UPI002B4A0B48|nr:peptidoglycan-binding protein [Intrasporangium sp.]HKX65712.1 peptidoglycan-binding protein [Intrasporangium sp.]
MAVVWRSLGLALASPALIVPSAATAVHAYTPPAPPTKTLPKALDVFVPYQGQTVCDPVARPGVLAFAKLMTSHYRMGSTSLIGRTCTSGTSEHYDGRAWDWMLDVGDPAESAVARSVLSWLTRSDASGVPGAMARRFGVMYIIYDRKMWRSYAPERGWAPYYGTNPHTDHIHFSFNYNGAAARTSWWTGVAATTVLTSLPRAGTTTVTVPSPQMVLSYGMRSEAVRQLQVRLGNLPTTGYYGSMTKARVVEYQRFAGLPQTGVADLKTQEILARRGWRTVAAAFPTLSHGMTSRAVQTLQAKLGSLPTTGYYGSMTKARVTAYQRFAGLPQTGTADPVTQYRLWVRGWTAGRTTYPTLSYGMTSTAVKNVQARLGKLPTTGYFGSMTKARVIEYQKFVGLAATGVADDRTQQLLYTRGWSTVLPASATVQKEAEVMTAFATEAAGADPTSPAVATISTATSYTPYKDVVLAMGSRGAAVRTLQRALGGVAVDGVFGSVTRDRVIGQQRSLALPETGVVTPDLWDVLEAREFPFVGQRMTVLRLGDNGPQVVAVQRLLGVRATGVFDERTRAAVKEAQARAGLASTGVVASRTWSLFDRLSA